MVKTDAFDRMSEAVELQTKFRTDVSGDVISDTIVGDDDDAWFTTRTDLMTALEEHDD